MSKKFTLFGVGEEHFQELRDYADKIAEKMEEEEEFESMIKYDVNTFLERAKLYSNLDIPDVVQYCEKVWGAASLSVIEFIVKHFGIGIRSHKAKSVLVAIIASACATPEECAFVMVTFKRAEELHGNFYLMNLLNKTDRANMITNVEKMAAIIERADVEKVGERIIEDKLLRITNITKKLYSIGDNKYPYEKEVRTFN